MSAHGRHAQESQARYVPTACYDERKRSAETLFFDYHREHNLEIKVARIFNTYAPQMYPTDGQAVSNFIVHALKDESITLYADGMQARSFCHVDDLIDGLHRLIETNAEVTGPINLGNPGEFTMHELAQQVIAETGAGVETIHQPLPLDDPRQRQPDIGHAGSQPGWVPEVALRDGLKPTVEYFRALVERGLA